MHNANDTAGCSAHAARLSQKHDGPTPMRYREYLPQGNQTKETLEKVGRWHRFGNEGSAAS